MEVNIVELVTIHHCSMKIGTLKIEDGSQHSEHDSSLFNIHANEGYTQGLCKQLDFDCITDFFGHTLLVGLVHWVLEHQTGEVCLQPLWNGIEI